MTASAMPAEPGRFVRHQLPWLLVALQLAWWSYGIWPISPVEGDEQGVLFGATGMLHHDPVLLHVRYLYPVQPGSYQLLVTLARGTGGSLETIFGITTAVGAIAFALAGARLLQILLGWPLGWMLVGMLCCQEVTTAACYMNTTALAGGPALLGIILSRRPDRAGWLGAGVALAVAGWLRADSLLVAPACLGLVYWARRRWSPALLQTAAIAGTAALGIMLLYWLSGTSLLAGYAAYAGRDGSLSGWRILGEMPLLLLSPLFALCAMGGCGLLVGRRQFALVLVVLAGSAASFYVYGFALTTPKYFYFLVPFILLPAVELVGWAVQAVGHLSIWRRRLAWAVGLGLVGSDGVLGVRTLAEDQRLFTTAPTWGHLWQGQSRAKALALVIGPGELMFNADGFRLRTGQWFSPWCWHREKSRMRNELATIRTWLAQNGDFSLLWSNWLPYQMITREMFAAGFSPAEPPQPDTGLAYPGLWQRGPQRVHVDFLGYVDNTYHPPHLPRYQLGAEVYFVGDRAHQPLSALPDGRPWRLVSAVPKGFIILQQLH